MLVNDLSNWNFLNLHLLLLSDYNLSLYFVGDEIIVSVLCLKEYRVYFSELIFVLLKLLILKYLIDNSFLLWII